MQKIKAHTCIVIDDEENAVLNLSEYIGNLPQLELLKTYTDPKMALKEILASVKVDLIFMDVDMPSIDGIELSRALRHKTDKLIFTTAHSKYAFDAFEVSANAFLLKPITLLNFVATVEKFFPVVNKRQA